MNWGTKLVIAMALFMGFIVTLGLLMFRSQTDDLVESNYYERGLKYDSDFARKSQVKTDGALPKITTENGFLKVSFVKPAAGKLTFRHPSKRSADFVMMFDDKAGQQWTVPLKQVPAGQWHLVMEWNSQAKDYLFEQEIRI